MEPVDPSPTDPGGDWAQLATLAAGVGVVGALGWAARSSRRAQSAVEDE